MLQNPARRRRNCTPSRSLIAQYQWMRKNGHEKRAQKTLDRFVKERGDSASSLNSTAWSLMNDEETAGKFDRMALALAERMQKRERRLAHNQLDTVALARFLNGQVDEAIRLQKLAMEKGRNSDYRRRLRTYQAAKLVVSPAAKPAPRKIAKIHDEE